MLLSEQTKTEYSNWLLVYSEISLLAEYVKAATETLPAFTAERREREVVRVTRILMDLLDPTNKEPNWLQTTEEFVRQSNVSAK